MSKLFFLSLLFIPFFSSAGIYENVAGAAQMVADGFQSIQDFLFIDLPAFISRFWDWLSFWSTKLMYLLMDSVTDFVFSLVDSIIQGINVASQVVSSISSLPVDVKQALVDMRVFDAMNMLFLAYSTRFLITLIPFVG